MQAKGKIACRHNYCCFSLLCGREKQPKLAPPSLRERFHIKLCSKLRGRLSKQKGKPLLSKSQATSNKRRTNVILIALDAKSLSFPYSEYLRAAQRADPLYRRPAILQHNRPRVLNLDLFPILHAISCWHYTLLRLIYFLYIFLLREQNFVNRFWAL